MESQAVDKLESHTDWLRRLIDRRVRPLGCTEEVLQEVMLAATKSPHWPTAEADQSPWLARVALRQCAMALRSWVRRQRRESNYASEQSTADRYLAEDPIYALIASEQRELIREQLGTLDSTAKSLLVMKYVQGLSYRQIGERLNWEVSTVEYRLAEARKQLRRRLVAVGLGREE
jgi:RNA polymerase sigma-70 factor (ECF subfamily)